MPQGGSEDGDGSGLVQEGQRDWHVRQKGPDAEGDLGEHGAGEREG
jgi:hypothetical protein